METVEKKVDKLIDAQNSQTLILQRLETAVLGDKEAGYVGLISRVKKNEDYISKDQKFKWTAAGVFLSLAAFKDKIFHWLGM